MKILLVTSALDRGGAETHVCSLAEELARLGHCVTVASAGGALVARLQNGGIRHVTVRWDTRAPVRLLLVGGAWRRFLRRERYDLIHAHARMPAFLTAREAKRLGIPLVATVHARFRTGGLFRRLSRWGDRTVAVSEDLASYVSTCYGVPQRNVSVIPNGIDTVRFQPTASKEEGVRVLFVSRLDNDCAKGAELLCALSARLTERFPHVELWMAGGGTALPRIRRMSEQIHCRNPTVRIRILGHEPQLDRLLPRVQVVLGVSRCALEAMACGVPVILGGDEGFLGVAEGDVLAEGAKSNFCCRGASPMTEETLFAALCDLLSRSHKERQALGKRLRDYVQTHADARCMARRTEEVYRQAIEACQGRKGVLLCGYYGYGNTGDEALLRAALCRAGEEMPTLAVRALTRRGAKDEAASGIPCIRRTSPLALRRAVRESSVLIFGGGTLLQDTTSLRSLAYYAYLLCYAQKHGVATRLWGNGLAPPRFALGALLMRRALVGCDFIGLRDEPSVAVARELLGQNCVLPIQRERDLVLAYPPSALVPRGETIRRLGLQGKRLIVLAPKGRAGRGIVRLFCEQAALRGGKGATPVVLSLFPREDGALCQRLGEALNGVLAEDLTPSEIVDLMRASEGVYGMRLHALIFAKLADVPFVGFDTDVKIEAFCRENGGTYFTECYAEK